MATKKKCPKCGHTKKLEEFAISKKKRYGRASECKACHRKMRKAHYEKNRRQEIERVRRRKQELWRWIAELKATLSCEECGEDRAECLEFHHDDPDTKERSISGAVAHGWSRKRILREIEKCTILCANCHRVFHAHA